MSVQLAICTHVCTYSQVYFQNEEAVPAILTQQGHSRTHPQHDARNLCGEWNRDHNPNQIRGLGPGVLLADDVFSHSCNHTIIEVLKTTKVSVSRASA